ncbi:MAG: LacI family transcriptional regulator [Bradyrhizobium sp.]|nr:MAG: LacI family transcriptional regulator [Bradyrhizobium sp.]
MAKLTITDIAGRAGVSKATVSRVLNKQAAGVGRETRARIQRILDETGFQPSATARTLSTGRSHSVGLVIPDIANPYYPLLVSGVEQTLVAAGYSLVLCNTGGNVAKEAAYIGILIDKGVDGVILNSSTSQDDSHVRLLEDADIPLVLLDRVVGRRAARYGVFVDNHFGARQAAEHLLARQDCALVFINGPPDLSQSIERRAGVEAAFAKSGLPRDRLRVVEADCTLEGGRRAIADLIEAAWDGSGKRRLSFNAAFAANDLMAFGALRALRHIGVLVPDEVEVIGFDDVEFARLAEPPLTTVAQPAMEMGAASADLILQLIAGARPRQKTLMMTPRLVLRGTTGARPASASETPRKGAKEHG